MAFALRHCIIKNAIDDLLKLIAAHLPENIEYPSTLYQFSKHFLNWKTKITTHMYCSKCGSYIGTVSKQCKDCNQINDLDSALQSGCYFIMFNIKDQKLNILNRHSSKIHLHKQAQGQQELLDLSNGRLYPKDDSDFLLITWNTDGVLVFKSSNFAIWPLQFVINELEPCSRFSNVLMGGLWFGKSNPKFDAFLMPFIQQVNDLSINGLDFDFGEGLKISKFTVGLALLMLLQGAR